MRVKRRHTRWLGLLGLAPVLGCFGLCDSPSEPEVRRCDTASTGVSVDTVEVSAWQVTGLQGLDMVMFDVTYLGANPPSCAEVAWSARSPEGAPLVAGERIRVETEPVEGGRRTSTPLWDLWPSDAPALEVEVITHGHTARDVACDWRYALDAGGCEAPDAGL